SVECPDWLTATIELPTGYDVHAIDTASLRLAGSVRADSHYSRFVDSDNDGRLELEVRFAFETVVPLLAPGANLLGLTGRVSGVEFAGLAAVTVADPRVNL